MSFHCASGTVVSSKYPISCCSSLTKKGVSGSPFYRWENRRSLSEVRWHAQVTQPIRDQLTVFIVKLYDLIGNKEIRQLRETLESTLDHRHTRVSDWTS